MDTMRWRETEHKWWSSRWKHERLECGFICYLVSSLVNICMLWYSCFPVLSCDFWDSHDSSSDENILTLLPSIHCGICISKCVSSLCCWIHQTYLSFMTFAFVCFLICFYFLFFFFLRPAPSSTKMAAGAGPGVRGSKTGLAGEARALLICF